MRNNEINKQVTIKYDDKYDEFQLLIRKSEKEEWKFVRGYQCVNALGQNEPNFIHYSILNELKDCFELGYEFIVYD